jgi:hypothetical protein
MRAPSSSSLIRDVSDEREMMEEMEIEMAARAGCVCVCVCVCLVSQSGWCDLDRSILD